MKKIIYLIPVLVFFSNKAFAEDLKCKTEESQKDSPFTITINDETKTNQACNDLKLQKSNVQVRYDSLEIDPKLNIAAYPNGVARGEKVSLTPYSNYLAFINKAEIRLFKSDKSIQSEPFKIIKIKANLNQSAYFEIPKNLFDDEIKYVLRVYGEKNIFDETAPKFLKLLDAERLVGNEESLKREKNIGYGESHLAIQNIPLAGGTITTNGEKVPQNSKISISGRNIPLADNGRFADKQIVPSGDHVIDVKIEDEKGDTSNLSRSLTIPKNDLFYIALADLTVGQNNVSGPASVVTGEDSKRNKGAAYFDGRLAFYLKGKIQDDWILTSSADTQEQPIGDLFTNFSSKDPRYLLDRLDPNSYYPIYGDDSTAIEDAPTKGKFYVKLEKGESSIMWGNFKTQLSGSELINYSRGLYGANAKHRSVATTKFGESRTELDAFIADPGTLGSFEELRATGGSLYYLRSQDIVTGSERLRIEVRDRDSGIILSSEYLSYGTDYDINYLQGRLVLTKPLSSTSSAETLVNSVSGGNPVFLVADYEYTPSITEIENLTKGGRLSYWINDHVKLGTTSYNQAGYGVDQDIKGGDLTLRYKPQTYIKIETAVSEGAGGRSLSSLDGGFNFNDTPQDSDPNIKATAFRSEAAIAFEEIGDGSYSGKLNAYFEQLEDGYSAPGKISNEDLVQFGFDGVFPITEKLSTQLKYDFKQGSRTGEIETNEAIANYQINPSSLFSLGIKNDLRNLETIDDQNVNNSNILSEDGRRVDVAIKLNYAPISEKGVKKNYEIYATGQATVKKDDGRNENNRIGVGGKYDINKKVTLNGEGNVGDGGFGGIAGVEYRATDRTSYYTNYQMDSMRTDLGQRSRSSSLVSGAKSRYSDSLSMYTEQKKQKFAGNSSGLLSAFGLDLAANDEWTFGGKFEAGSVSDEIAGDIERRALSVNTNYSKDKVKYANAVEWRHENGNVLGKLDSYLVKNNLGYQTAPDWRFLGEANFAISKSDLGSNLEANYIEYSNSFAYRPIENDKVNGLLRYTYLSDLATAGQLAPNESSLANEYEQRSHVFSGDAIFDVIPQLSIGGKLGYRRGEIRSTSSKNNEWFSSEAYLVILRTDLHIVKKWDLSIEGRRLAVTEAEDAKMGALVAVYRHIGNNAKLGVGYNFTDFSDDLTDLSYRSQGFFVNMIGKF
ncbi:MAG: hypothetical protein ACJAZX_000732 [Rickettsiales bacterium]|jgi:hypothetical protein